MLGRMGLPELLVIVFFLGMVAVYFIPTIIATSRHKANLAPIIAVNVLLGWSVVGWIVALAWALSTQSVDTMPVGVAPAGVAPSSRLCTNCGKYSQYGTAFCPHCGQSA